MRPWLILWILTWGCSLLSADKTTSPAQATIQAYIINHQNEPRWRWMRALAQRCGLRPIRAASVDVRRAAPTATQALFFGGLRPPRLQALPVVDSNAWRALGVTLSHIQAWAQLAQDEGVPSDAWALFFEDDCNTVPDVSGLDLPSIIRTTLAAASSHGHDFLFFGLCYRECRRPLNAVTISGGLKYMWPCSGKCAHAYALRRSAAHGFWSRLRDFRFANPCVGMHLRHCQRRSLVYMSRGGALCCAGNKTDEWVPDPRFGQDWGPDAWMRPYCVAHDCGLVVTGARPELGVFFQDRLKFGSLVWQNRHQRFMNTSSLVVQ
eukprot:EG_transcript_18467